MPYIDRVLQPGEQVVAIGRLHPLIYFRAILAFLIGVAVLIAGAVWGAADARTAGAVGFAALALVALVIFASAYIRRKFTEIAVTDRRIVYKTGVMRRHSVEMNMSRVESVVVDQSLLGRIFDFGTIHVRGVGVGIENLTGIDHPLQLRSAILAR